MLNIIVIIITIAFKLVNEVNSFENYNEYLGSLKSTTEANIFSVLNPWNGVKAVNKLPIVDHHFEDDGDTDDYNNQKIIGEATNSRRNLYNHKRLKEHVVVDRDKKDIKEKDLKRVKRASKRTIGSVLRARGKTTPGTEFSSEEVDGDKKVDGASGEEVSKDEIRDYDDKDDKDIKKERKKKGATKELITSVEKKVSDKNEEKAPNVVEENKISTKPMDIADAIRERNDKIRKEFEAKEEDERNKIARDEAIKKAEEAEAAKRASYMLDSDDKSNKKGDKTSVEEKRPKKPSRKQVLRKSYEHTKLKTENPKKDFHTDKYAMTLNSGESLKKKKKIITKENSNPVNRRMAHKKVRRSNAENDRNSDSNDGRNRRVNYRQKARENLEAYRTPNEQAPADDRKKEPIIADQKTVGNIASQTKHKPVPGDPAIPVSEDRKKDPLLADLQKTVGNLASQMKHKPEPGDPAIPVSEDRKKDPLLADLQKTVGNLASQMKHKPEPGEPAITVSADRKKDPIIADQKTVGNLTEIDRNSDSNDGRNRRVNYKQKARENLEAYRTPNEQTPAANSKKDPLLADLQKTVGNLASQTKHKPEPGDPATTVSEDRKKDPLLADLQKTVGNLASQMKHKPEPGDPAKVVSEDRQDPLMVDLEITLGNIEPGEPTIPVSDDRKKEPLPLKVPKGEIGGKVKTKPEAQAPEIADDMFTKTSNRRRGREIFQIPNAAVLNNDYTMYDNEPDYEYERRNLHNPDPQNVNVSIDTGPNQTGTTPKQGSEVDAVEKELNKSHNRPLENKSEKHKMLISTNLTSKTQDVKPKEDVPVMKANIDRLLKNENNLSEFVNNEITTVQTTELPLRAAVATLHKKEESKPESYKSAMKLVGPMVVGKLGKKHRDHKGTIQGDLNTDTAYYKTVATDDTAKTLIGPVLSSKFSQTAPIRNNFNIENLYVLGSEFIDIKDKLKSKHQKETKRASCHRRKKQKPVEISINVAQIKDGVQTIVEPLHANGKETDLGVSDTENGENNNGNGPNSNENGPNNNGNGPNDNENGPNDNGNDPNDNGNGPNNNDDSNNGNDDTNKNKNSDAGGGDVENSTTKEGNWAKLVQKLSGSGVLDIAADYTPKKFDPNDYYKSDLDSDALHKDSSSGEYECIKKHKNNTNVTSTDTTRRHHPHSSHKHHKHHKHGLRINIPGNNNAKQSRFITEQNKNYDAIADMLMDYGKFLQLFPINKGKKMPKNEDSKPQNGNEKKESIKMKSYIKELKSAFQKHFHGLGQYDWLGTAVDTESSLMKLLGLTIQVATHKEIHRRDLNLLNYVKFIFESAVREFPDYIIENTLQAYMPGEGIEEASDMTDKPEDKKHRAQSDEGFEMPNSKYLFREYYIPEPYRRDDKTLILNYLGMKKQGKEKNLEDKTIIDTRFKEFLIETQSNLAKLHDLFAMTPNEPNPDDWVTMIRTLFISMNFNQRLRYAQILLHMFTTDLFNNIEETLRDDAKPVKDNVNDMILILKILTYIRLI